MQVPFVTQFRTKVMMQSFYCPTVSTVLCCVLAALYALANLPTVDNNRLPFPGIVLCWLVVSCECVC